MVYHTYILYSAKLGKYYIGSCEDMDTRIHQHNSGRNISTKAGVPWEIKYFEVFNTRKEAMKRERMIKDKKSRKYIEWLISTVG